MARRHRRRRAVGGSDPLSEVRSGTGEIRAALAAAGKRGEKLVLVDATIDEDLLAIGSACFDQSLLTGGSGIAIGLPANFIAAGLAAGSGSVPVRV